MNETKIIGSKELEDKKYGYNVEIYQLEEGKEAKKATEKVVLTNKGESKKAIGIKIKTQGVFYFSGLSKFKIKMCKKETSKEIYQLYEIEKWEEFRKERRRYIKDMKKWFPQMENFSGQLKSTRSQSMTCWKKTKSWKQGQRPVSKAR